MQTKMLEELSVMRREVARRNDAWARLKEEFAAETAQRPVPVDVALFDELDRVCDATVARTRTSKIRNVAIRG
jgi:hypothetical protein